MQSLRPGDKDTSKQDIRERTDSTYKQGRIEDKGEEISPSERYRLSDPSEDPDLYPTHPFPGATPGPTPGK